MKYSNLPKLDYEKVFQKGNRFFHKPTEKMLTFLKTVSGKKYEMFIFRDQNGNWVQYSLHYLGFYFFTEFEIY